jgi:hypothetical protein
VTYDEISEPMRGFLGAWQGFRKIGFKSSELYYTIARSVLAGGAVSCFVTLRAQRKIFNLEVGPIESEDAFEKEWGLVRKALEKRDIPDPDLERIWAESLPFRKAADFIIALTNKGFKIPKELS